MIRGRVLRASDGHCLIPHARKTSNALERMRGLLCRPPLQTGQALLINPCPSVHTFGMGYNIDIAYLDREYRIIKLLAGLKPWRMSGGNGARMTLEMAENTIQQLQLETGMQLLWQDEQ